MSDYWSDVLSDKLDDFVNKKNLVFAFKIISIFYILLTFYWLVRSDFHDYFYTIFSTLIYLVILIISFFFLYIVKMKVVPFILYKKNEIRKGNIWFLKLLVEDSPLFVFRMYVFLYNLILLGIAIVFGYIIFGSFLISMSLIVISLINVLYVVGTSLDNFIISIIFTVISVTVFLCWFVLIEKGVMGKKELFLHLYNEFNDSDDKNKSIWLSKLLILMKGSSFSHPSRSVRYFSKKILEDIVLYYQNVILFLVDEKVIYNKLLPELKELILNGDYKGLLKHLNRLEDISKRDKIAYKLHVDIIKSLNKGIVSEDVLSFSTQMRKIKFIEASMSDYFIVKVWRFVEDTWTGKILAIVVFLVITLLLLNGGYLIGILGFFGIPIEAFKKMFFSRLGFEI